MSSSHNGGHLECENWYSPKETTYFNGSDIQGLFLCALRVCTLGFGPPDHGIRVFRPPKPRITKVEDTNLKSFTRSRATSKIGLIPQGAPLQINLPTSFKG